MKTEPVLGKMVMAMKLTIAMVMEIFITITAVLVMKLYITAVMVMKLSITAVMVMKLSITMVMVMKLSITMVMVMKNGVRVTSPRSLRSDHSLARVPCATGWCVAAGNFFATSSLQAVGALLRGVK